jgi:hypothetical protein
VKVDGMERLKGHVKEKSFRREAEKKEANGDEGLKVEEGYKSFN